MSIYLAVFGKPRYLGLIDILEPAPKAGQWIVIKTVRGLEMGMLGGSLSQEQEAKYRTACLEEPGDEQTKGPEPMLQEVDIVEVATEAQISEYYARRGDEESVLIRARQLLCTHQLLMKLVDVEYTMDRKKLFFYFTSEQRIDFRAYVRDLAKEFRIRIEMRQIGVRDEAKTVRGLAPCGRACCCSYWLHRFTPICIRMVKEQNLALNPTKISGICGRLMCCMAYEHPTYSELWKSLPSPGSKIKTAQGNFVLEGLDLRTESVRVRFPQGKEVAIAIAEFSDFKETVLRGEAWENDVQDEPFRRVPVAPRKTQSAPIGAKTETPKGGSAKEETPKHESIKNESLRNNRKFKPEKISLEKHIAGRIGESIPSQAETESKGTVPSKKRTRRRKNNNTTGAENAIAQPGEQPQKSAATVQQQTPPQKTRPRPQVQRPESSLDDSKKGKSEQQNETQTGEKQVERSRRRPRRRPSEGRSTEEKKS